MDFTTDGPVLLTLLAYIIGMVVGVIIARIGMRARVNDAFERGKVDEEQTHEHEKAELSADLSEQLANIRDNLLNTLEAYDNAVQVVDDRLPGVGQGVAALEGPERPTPQIEFKPGEASTEEPMSNASEDAAQGGADEEEKKPDATAEDDSYEAEPLSGSNGAVKAFNS